MKNWEKYKEIFNSNIYSNSGTIEGLYADFLSFEEKDGKIIPKKKAEKDLPNDFLNYLSDVEIDYPKLNIKIFGKLPENWLIGNYKKIYVGFYKDNKIRANAASGGIISGTQSYLLENGKIDGAITTRMREDKPYMAETFIAKSKEEILQSSQSIYCSHPTNLVLKYLPGNFKSLSYTGLPEQIASIRKLQLSNNKKVENINYIISPFYGHSLKISAIESFLKSHGIKNLSDIKKLSYRAGEWPGYMRVELKNGNTVQLKKFHANYLIPSHIEKYSLYQVDYMSELSDISVGDSWSPKYEERGKGWSVIIARSEKGLNLIEELISKDLIEVKEIEEKELIQMHSHGLDFKKRGSFIRINNKKKKGEIVPNYGYEPTNIPKKREIFESFLSMLFKIFQMKIVIFFIEKTPPKVMGYVFEKTRNIWKLKTKNAKKENINELTFITYDK